MFPSQGDTIHAIINKDFVARYDRIMQEGYSMIIVNFSVMPSVGAYRINHHAYKIAFLDTTRVRICGNLPRQLIGFQPVPFSDILDGNFYTDYLVGEYS